MTMEAVEFIRTLQKLCTGSKCYDCPLEEKGRCIIIHAVNPEESVRIVEEWAAEQEQQKAEQERQKAEQERQKPEQEKRMREMEGQIRILREKTQMLAEANAMLENKVNTLQEAIEEERKEIRLVDAFSMRFAEIECNERGRMEKRLTERIEKLEGGEN